MYFQPPCAQKGATSVNIPSLLVKEPVVPARHKAAMYSPPWDSITCKLLWCNSQLDPGKDHPSTLSPVIGTYWACLPNLLPQWLSGHMGPCHTPYSKWRKMVAASLSIGLEYNRDMRGLAALLLTCGHPALGMTTFSAPVLFLRLFYISAG